MTEELNLPGGTLKVTRADITDLDIESFVYYARHDLQLGSGFGTAISQRGGPSVQEELDKLGRLETTEAIVSGAGEMKAKHIIHAVGPRFQEEDLESKLRTTIKNALSAAEKAGLSAVAFPPMGAGFYGVPLEQSAAVTVGMLAAYLKDNQPKIKEIVVCANDNREFKPLSAELAGLSRA